MSLRPSILFRVKSQSGVIWGHRGKILIFTKKKVYHVIHTLASHLRDQQGNWGQSGVDVSKPAGYAVCDGNISSLLLFSILLLEYHHIMIDIIISSIWDSAIVFNICGVLRQWSFTSVERCFLFWKHEILK